MKKRKKQIKISPSLVLNLFVAAITIYLIIYFVTSKDGVIDLLSQPDSFNVLWLVIAVVVYDMNAIIDSVVTLIYLRTQYPDFRFIDAVKVAFVGIFFAAITPSSTGGQPMQLYLMSKMNVSVGFGSSCMTQKFIVYQIITVCFSIAAIVFRFDYFRSAFTNFWSTAFIVLGLISQLGFTALFLLLSFSKNTTAKMINFIDKLMHKFKFIKNPDSKTSSLKCEVEKFHEGNKLLYKSKKLLVLIYFLVFLQVLCIMSAPYFIYLSLEMPQIAVANGQEAGSFFDFICIQAFVLFTSNLIPLPGASGGAELAFTMYFKKFFVIGNVNKIKPAILMWRFVSYYGTMIISAPFSYLTKGKKEEDRRKQLEQIAMKTNASEIITDITSETNSEIESTIQSNNT